MMYLRLAWATLILAALTAAQPPPATDPKDLATLSGKTVSDAGQPLKKTTLTLRSLGGSTPQSGGAGQNYTAASDAEGKFVFEGVQPGRYQLMADRQGYLRQTYGSKRSMSMGTVLTLSKGEQRKDLTFALTPQATISGKVLDDDGDPVANATVRAMRYAYMTGKRQLLPSGQASSDENGDYKIGGLAAGRYYVTAAKQSGMFMSDAATQAAKPGKIEEDLVSTYFPSVTDLSSATPIEIAAGRSVPGTDIRLRKAQVVRIKGKVAGNLPNQQMQRLRIMLLPSGAFMMGPFGSASASLTKDGTFELTRVLPGSYTVAATTMEGMMQILGRQQIDVGGQNLEGVVLNLQAPFELRGSVKTEGEPKAATPGSSPAAASAPSTAMRVTMNPSDGMGFNTPQATVNDDGTFVLPNLSAGKYRLSVYGNAPGTYLKAIRYGDRDVLAEGMDLSDGASASIQVIFSTAAGEVTGSVQADGQPATSGTVTLVPDPPQPELQWLYSQAGVENGQFSMKNVTPGKYRVYAWEELETGAQRDPEFLKPLESLGVSVTVAENGKEQVTLTRISAAAVDDARQKSGR